MELTIPDYIQSRMEAIRKDQHNGSAELALQSADIVRDVLAGNPGQNLKTTIEITLAVIENLKVIRPTMAPIHNLMEQLEEIIKNYDKDSDDAEISGLVRDLDKHSFKVKEDRHKVIKNASKLLVSGKKILTHSFSSTINRVFRFNQERNIDVFVSESRPIREGTRTARQLAFMGYHVSLITDMEVGHFMSEIDLVMVGADAILDDGTVVNKMGSYLIALAAKAHNKPFYVVCEDLKVTNQKDIELEEMPPNEILPDYKSSNIKVRNVYYDRTPPDLVTAIINSKWEAPSV